eukprot:CAMPEP_0194202606 /NCGR_PEP_ID=MMETSP0156-20130528/2589_1 /TAXON_ID=33649 /ORGANISM="Thalassionema nitzschioides, Strain L26-B" /LENGTH=465 /DNA_ID=CAMNT_0038928149 /DNA_START=135 /DNA_END=1532 /DNA_ORIENTATION=-
MISSNRSFFLVIITLLLQCHQTIGFATTSSLTSTQSRIRSSSAIFVATKKKTTTATSTNEVQQQKLQAAAPSSFDGVSYNVSLATTAESIPMGEPYTTKLAAVETTNTAADDDDNVDNNTNMEGLVWRGVILVLCGLWASNFSAAKLILAEPGVDSSLYAVARFGVAALALLPAGLKRRGTVSPETLTKSVQCGAWVAFGYLGQTLGLLTTTASKSCVICSLHCVFVAALSELWRVQKFKGNSNGEGTNYDTQRLLPALVAVAGVAVIELQGAGGAPTIGDGLSLAQPIGFGMGYLTLEQIMEDSPEAALPVSAIKLSVVAAASLIMFEVLPHLTSMGTTTHSADFVQIPDFTPILNSPVALGGILYTGLVTTALALWVESQAFRRVPATDASLILTTEPLMAAGIGALTLGETFGVSDYVGAAMIVGACVLATVLDSPASGDDDCDPKVDDQCQLERKRPYKTV